MKVGLIDGISWDETHPKDLAKGSARLFVAQEDADEIHAKPLQHEAMWWRAHQFRKKGDRTGEEKDYTAALDGFAQIEAADPLPEVRIGIFAERIKIALGRGDEEDFRRHLAAATVWLPQAKYHARQPEPAGGLWPPYMGSHLIVNFLDAKLRGVARFGSQGPDPVSEMQSIGTELKQFRDGLTALLTQVTLPYAQAEIIAKSATDSTQQIVV